VDPTLVGGSVIEPVLGVSMAALAGGTGAAGFVGVRRQPPIARSQRVERGPRPGRRASSRTRRRELDREIPQLLDLLAAGSAAGLSAPAGLRRAVSALRGPLGEELRTALRSVELGARWRTELGDLAERLDVPDLRRTVAVLARTETLGTSLSEATRELAADVRGARRAAVTERARAAPVKMLFPLVFLILPAFLLLTVVPVLLTTVRSIS
jgi:tight adherence protein C